MIRCHIPLVFILPSFLFFFLVPCLYFFFHASTSIDYRTPPGSGARNLEKDHGGGVGLAKVCVQFVYLSSLLGTNSFIY